MGWREIIFFFCVDDDWCAEAWDSLFLLARILFVSSFAPLLFVFEGEGALFTGLLVMVFVFERACFWLQQFVFG